MNLPNLFSGMNQLSRIVNQLQGSNLSECPDLYFHEITDVTEEPLPEGNSYSLQVSACKLAQLFHTLSQDRQIALDAFAIAKDGQLLFSGYRPPYAKNIPHITNSTCKTVTAIAVQFAVSEGLLKKEDTVISYFPEYENLLTPKYVKQITIEHLLTMTSCTKCNELTSFVQDNWIEAFLTSDCQQEPGSYFIYNSIDYIRIIKIFGKI